MSDVLDLLPKIPHTVGIGALLSSLRKSPIAPDLTFEQMANVTDATAELEHQHCVEAGEYGKVWYRYQYCTVP